MDMTTSMQGPAKGCGRDPSLAKSHTQQTLTSIVPSMALLTSPNFKDKALDCQDRSSSLSSNGGQP